MRYYARVVKKYAPGDIVFSENSECDGMYIIDTGRVRVFKAIEIGGKKSEVELCDLGPRSMFGEMAMIDESPRSATVQAVERTECTVITKKIFEDQLTRIPPWMVNMIRMLVARLRETNEKLRKQVEEYTPNPMDVGVIAIPEEGSPEARMEESKPGTGLGIGSTVNAENANQSPRYTSRDIIRSLFDADE